MERPKGESSTKKNEIICDKCKSRFSVADAGVTMKKGTTESLPGYGEVSYIFFRCPSCREIYMVMSEDATIIAIRDDIHIQLNKARNVALDIKNATTHETQLIHQREYDKVMERCEKLNKRLKRKVDILNKKVKAYLKRKESEENKDGESERK